MAALTKQRWLILAHAFNMDGRAASQTITDKIPHLLDANIELVVLSGALGEQDHRFEHHRLWPWGPAGIRFELRHVLRKHLSGWVYRVCMVLLSLPLLPFMLIEKLLFPLESSWSWRFAAVAQARRLARQRPFDWIYSTGGAYAAHLAAADLKKEWGIPWLAEVHDPFVMPGHTPQSRHDKMKLEVERRICSEADLAVLFTDQALASARTRQPQLQGRGRVILPGMDSPFPNGLPPRQRGAKCVLGHFGSLSPTRSLVCMLQALAWLHQHAPQVLADIELQVTGGPLDERARLYLESSPVREVVRHLGRIETDPTTGESGRSQILKRMRAADVLLLIHGEDPICAEYIPSKLYEYVWMQRPILAQVHPGNAQMARMLSEMGHTTVLADDLSSAHTIEALAHALLDFHHQWQQTGLPDNGLSSPYSTQRSVDQLLSWAHALEANA